MRMPQRVQPPKLYNACKTKLLRYKTVDFGLRDSALIFSRGAKTWIISQVLSQVKDQLVFSEEIENYRIKIKEPTLVKLYSGVG